MLICKRCDKTKDSSEFSEPVGDKKVFTKGKTCKACKKLIKGINSKKRYQETKHIDKEAKLKVNRDWHKNNKASVRLRNSEWQKNNQDRVRHNTLMSAHGITLDDYKSMLIQQNNLCAICHGAETKISKKTGRTKNFCVDHNHKTGRIRGLLCDDCNIAIGKMKENINSLKAAIEYLSKENENVGN